MKKYIGKKYIGKKYIGLLFLFCHFFAVNEVLATSDIPEDTRNLYQKLAKLNALEGKFTQTITDHEDYVLQNSTGKLVLKRPANIYWQTKPPYEQLIVGNDEKLWVYDPDLEQATVYANDRVMLGPVALLSSSVEVLHKRFNVTKVASEDKILDSYILIPNSVDGAESEQSFDALHFTFRDDTLLSITMKDRLQQTTEIVLTDVVMNHAVDNSLFTFYVPAGTDILENKE